MTNFRELLLLLERGGVRFVVIGGVAATVHGASRLTRDIDVVYARDRENIGRLAAAFASHRPYLRGAPPGLPSKRAAGRPKDLEAIAELEALLVEREPARHN